MKLFAELFTIAVQVDEKMKTKKMKYCNLVDSTCGRRRRRRSKNTIMAYKFILYFIYRNIVEHQKHKREHLKSENFSVTYANFIGVLLRSGTNLSFIISCKLEINFDPYFRLFRTTSLKYFGDRNDSFVIY